jgi:hypothetical protein
MGIGPVGGPQKPPLEKPDLYPRPTPQYGGMAQAPIGGNYALPMPRQVPPRYGGMPGNPLVDAISGFRDDGAQMGGLQSMNMEGRGYNALPPTVSEPLPPAAPQVSMPYTPLPPITQDQFIQSQRVGSPALSAMNMQGRGYRALPPEGLQRLATLQRLGGLQSSGRPRKR